MFFLIEEVYYRGALKGLITHMAVEQDEEMASCDKVLRSVTWSLSFLRR